MNEQRFLAMKKRVEIGIVGAGEIAGLCELLLDMPTCMQTTKCLEDCQIFYILKSSYERLILRRNPATVDKMKDYVHMKLKARNARLSSVQPIDLFRSIQYSIELADRSRRGAVSELASGGKGVESDLPTKGAVIQMDVATRPKSAAHFLARSAHKKQTSRSHSLSVGKKAENVKSANQSGLKQHSPAESEPLDNEAQNVEIIEEVDQVDDVREPAGLRTNASYCLGAIRSGGGGLSAALARLEQQQLELNNENEHLENRIKCWHRELGHNKVFVAPLKDAEVRKPASFNQIILLSKFSKDLIKDF
jgi:hypothetical protein